MTAQTATGFAADSPLNPRICAAYARTRPVKGSTRSVLDVLARQTDWDGAQAGCVQMRIKKIAERLGSSPRTVSRAIAVLLKKGEIVVEKIMRADGSRSSNFYRIPGLLKFALGMKEDSPNPAEATSEPAEKPAESAEEQAEKPSSEHDGDSCLKTDTCDDICHGVMTICHDISLPLMPLKDNPLPQTTEANAAPPVGGESKQERLSKKAYWALVNLGKAAAEAFEKCALPNWKGLREKTRGAHAWLGRRVAETGGVDAMTGRVTSDLNNPKLRKKPLGIQYFTAIGEKKAGEWGKAAKPSAPKASAPVAQTALAVPAAAQKPWMVYLPVYRSYIPDICPKLLAQGRDASYKQAFGEHGPIAFAVWWAREKLELPHPTLAPVATSPA